jgi:hypothetical protein
MPCWTARILRFFESLELFVKWDVRYSMAFGVSIWHQDDAST